MINRDELLIEMKEEQRLRKVLRRLLEGYFSEKEEKTLLEENRFRKIVRTLIKEASADVPAEQPQRSTGINALRTLLKNIIPTLEDAYKELTTAKEQRDSFRAHILNAVENSLKPADLNLVPRDEELEEEVELDIDVEEDKFIPARPEDEEAAAEDEEGEEEEDSFEQITGMNTTGRNFASTTFNKVEKQILDAYEVIAGDKEDGEQFKDYLLTNLKLYFDRFEEELKPDLPEPESPDYEGTPETAESTEEVDIEAAAEEVI
jgi:predicted CopG family antitoxin